MMQQVQQGRALKVPATESLPVSLFNCADTDKDSVAGKGPKSLVTGGLHLSIPSYFKAIELLGSSSIGTSNCALYLLIS